jgi:hypothetical protein
MSYDVTNKIGPAICQGRRQELEAKLFTVKLHSYLASLPAGTLRSCAPVRHSVYILYYFV